jgi:hypothetical protein
MRSYALPAQPFFGREKDGAGAASPLPSNEIHQFMAGPPWREAGEWARLPAYAFIDQTGELQ